MAKYDVKFIYAWPLSARLLALALICAVILFLAYFFDLSSLSATLTISKNKELDLKRQVVIIFKDEAMIKSGLKHIQQMEEALLNLKKEIIVYSKVPELLNTILNTGEKHQVHFHLFSPGTQEIVKIMPIQLPDEITKPAKTSSKTIEPEIKPLEIYSKLPIKIIAIGNYHDLSTFISTVANMPMITSIGRFTLTNQNKTDVLGDALAKEVLSKNLLTLELTLEIPIVREVKNAAI